MPDEDTRAVVPGESSSDLEKRGYTPPKGKQLSPDDFPNLPEGPAPGAAKNQPTSPDDESKE